VRLHLVDGTYELVRAHFAPGPSRRDHKGHDVKASVGMIGSLLKLLHDPDEAVTHIAVAFDDPVESFRNRLYAGYKTSAAIPDVVLAQFATAKAGIEALGLLLWSQSEYEADDAIATAALHASVAFDEVRILSPDKDFGQMVNGRVTQIDRARTRIFDADGVMERLGVPPDLVPLFLAISGDAADGIPGVPGFGVKSTAALVNHYRSLDAIPSECALWQLSLRGRDTLCKTFNAMRDDVELFLSLATLRTDVPLDLATASLVYSGAPREQFLRWCDQVDATTLKTRPRRWSST